MELEPAGIIPPDDDPVRGRDPIVDRVEAALDAGREEEALALAEQALAAGEGQRLDLLFLAGDESDYITGISLLVDDGASLPRRD